jgi:hypothetical protein
MTSHKSHQESWSRCRRAFEGRLSDTSLFAVPLQVIDWAVSHGIDKRLCAWRSHDHLVISNRPWQAVRASKLIVIPKPKSVELRLYHDAGLAQSSDVARSGLDQELSRLLSEFSPSSTSSS